MAYGHTAILCLGSNLSTPSLLWEVEKRLASIVSIKTYGKLVTSPDVSNRSNSIYYNKVLRIETTYELDELKNVCRQLEIESGKSKESKEQGIIPIDIDILMYDKHIIKPKDITQAYVKASLNIK